MPRIPKPSAEALQKAKKFVENSENLAGLIELIPPASALHQYAPDVQREILVGIVNGKTIYELQKELNTRDIPITWQVIQRIQKRLLPILMKGAMPNSFFHRADVKEQLKTIEFLISEQYARVMDKIENEDKEKGRVTINQKVSFPSKEAYEDFKKDVAAYYAGTMTEAERGVFLTIMNVEGYDVSLTRDIEVLTKLHKEYLALRLFLGDVTVRLDDKEKEKKTEEQKAGQLPAEIAKQISESTRKAALGVVSMVQDQEDGVYKREQEAKESGQDKTD